MYFPTKKGVCVALPKKVYASISMCGIVGYLGNQPFQEFILSGLKLLQNRGYDSAGLSYIENGKINTIKYASAQSSDAIMQLEHDVLLTTAKGTEKSAEKPAETLSDPLLAPLSDPLVQVSIGHTRWATHGPKTQLNAHPHHDNSGRISLVHNGIIENFQEIKYGLLQLRYVFHSQTDTEVIAVLIGRYLDAGYSMEESVRKTVTQLSGTWALVIIHRDYPNKMWVCRNGSPLLLGSADDYIMVASEHIAFGPYIQKYIVLDNHDILEITRTPDQGFTYNTCLAKYAVQEKAVSAIEYEPTGHAHWMIKEIAEQSEAIYRAINHGGRIPTEDRVKLGGLDQCREQLLALDHLILLGCGTSYHAGLWALDLFKSLDIFDTVTIYDGAEFGEHDIPGRRANGTNRPTCRTGLILLSQSGETRDLHRCLQIANEHDLMTIGLVNVPDSTIARETRCGVYLNAGREVAVASTKSFTNQCVGLTLVAIWFSQERGTCLSKRERMIQDLRKLPLQVKHIMEKDTIEAIQYVVKRLANQFDNISSTLSMFLLGKGSEEAIAREGALKLKEVAYVHAEGYSSSALKHGPFALICENTPIILIDVDQQYRTKNQNAMHEVMVRGAYVVHIRDYLDQECERGTGLFVQPNSTFSGILANVYVQILSYYLAIERGVNPDFPRNLAKVVTVE